MKYLILLFTCLCANAHAQYWQQKVEYKIDVTLDASTHRYNGKEVIVYYNNSPDEITELYFHLYNNAFQPGSQMDVRSRTISDPDPRVGNRIAELAPQDQGYLHVKSIAIGSEKAEMEELETILRIRLAKPIAPNSKALISLDFEGQAPAQIRRSGVNNAEGIDFSMSQWYPKLCEYDRKGWHPNPYIGREFYGVWGNFEVNITLPKKYIVGATGVLQNPNEIGYGYEEDASKVKLPSGDQLTWKFKANQVHDFVWAADPDYAHDQIKTADGVVLHFLYQKEPDYVSIWKDAQPLISKGFQFLSDHYGKYPYPVYSFIQGGDGGMEYPMATLITGRRKLPSLVGVSLHEAAHAWYQGMLGTNESLYAWMDEGFTSFASAEAMAAVFTNRLPNDHSQAMAGYLEIANSKDEEPLTTHADHFNTNYAYNMAAYSKGETYLAQLKYIVGKAAFEKGLKRYFETWKFKHPDPDDFLHCMELESHMILDWYNEYFVQTTKKIDYAISSLASGPKNTVITLTRKGGMIMPVDVEVTYKDGRFATYTIPLDLMRMSKPSDGYQGEWKSMPAWKWTNSTYTLSIPGLATEIESIVIDPEKEMADSDRTNNMVAPAEGIQFLLQNN